MLALTACTNGSDTTDNVKANPAWQRYSEARKAKDLDRTLALIDSMEQENIISTPKADHLRGFAYDTGWQMQIAEHFYKKSFEGYASDPLQDWDEYADAGYRWACLRFGRGDIEGALSVITGLLSQAEKNNAFPQNTEESLLVLMADCQMQLHQNDEARRNLQKAYEIRQQVNGASQQADIPYLSMNISIGLYDMGDVEGAQEWLNRAEEELALYEQQGDSLVTEEWKGHIALKRARYLQATGHAAEAAAAYAAIPHSRIMEPHGYMEAAEYLMDAGRYDEAAYWYEQIDGTYQATDGAQMTFDLIAGRLSPRYAAYRKAGRNSDALVIADSINAAIDSALVWQKKNDAAELAVIYHTHEKDLQLADLRFTVYLHRLMAIALVIITLLIGYLLWRAYKFNKVLSAKNRGLYEQIQQREQEEQRERASWFARDDLTSEQQLFRRLCTLMAEQQPYTDEGLNREALAQMLGTNPKYIDQAIRTCSHGETTSNFITRYRLEHVARLLKTTDDPVSLIGEMAGIPSRVTLARLFRNAYSMTCSEFRKAARAES